MDMLVKLYEVQDCPELIEKLKNEGVLIKKAMTPDLTKITSWVKETFGQGWADECTAGILGDGCWIAVKDKKVIGFACYDATMKDFFGPTGVQEEMRGHGIGKALLIRCLISMRERGYAYAIIGSAGPKDFYRKAVGAIGIEGSIPGAYRNMVGAE